MLDACDQDSNRAVAVESYLLRSRSWTPQRRLHMRYLEQRVAAENLNAHIITLPLVRDKDGASRTHYMHNASRPPSFPGPAVRRSRTGLARPARSACM